MAVDFTLGTSDNKFQGTFLITKQKNNTLTLYTKNKFIDQDIKLKFNVQPATLSVKYANDSNNNSTIFSNITTSDTDNGISISVGGSPGAVLCDGPIEGFISKQNNDVLIPAPSGSNNQRTVYNISGVTLSPPASGSRSFDFTFPNGNINNYITVRVSIDSECNIRVDNVD